MAAGGSLESDGLVTLVNKMEDKLHSTETELINLERRLEVEYSSMLDDNGSMVNSLKNPVQVVKRINHAKSEFEKIKEDVVEIQKEQKAVLDAARVGFSKLLSAVSLLENKVLDPQEGDARVVEQEQELLSLLDHMAKTALPPTIKSEPLSDLPALPPTIKSEPLSLPPTIKSKPLSDLPEASH